MCCINDSLNHIMLFIVGRNASCAPKKIQKQTNLISLFIRKLHIVVKHFLQLHFKMKCLTCRTIIKLIIFRDKLGLTPSVSVRASRKYCTALYCTGAVNYGHCEATQQPPPSILLINKHFTSGTASNSQLLPLPLHARHFTCPHAYEFP